MANERKAKPKRAETVAKFDAVIADIAAHGRAKRALAEHKINPREFWARLAVDTDFANRYARAKVQGMHAIAAEMLDIADESRIGQIVTEGPKGIETKTADMVERARLQIDTRKWLLARLVPKIYGDRMTLAGDDDNPIAIDVKHAKAKLLSRLGALTDARGNTEASGEVKR